MYRERERESQGACVHVQCLLYKLPLGLLAHSLVYSVYIHTPGRHRIDEFTMAIWHKQSTSTCIRTMINPCVSLWKAASCLCVAMHELLLLLLLSMIIISLTVNVRTMQIYNGIKVFYSISVKQHT